MTFRLLTAWGVVAAVVLAVELVRADVLATLGTSWSLSFVVTVAFGIWACRAEPDNRAAVRLLLFGCVALTWLAVSVELIASGMSVALNLLAQMLGLAMVTAQAAALVRYPDGKPLLAAERRLVGGLGALTVLLPPALLLTHATVVPTWILQFSRDSDGLVLPELPSPWYVGGPAGLTQVLDESLLGLAPLLAVVVLALRYRRLDAEQRPRMAWPVVAALILVLGLVVNALAEAGALPHLVGDGVLIACHVLLPAALGVGIAAPSLLDALGAVRRTLPFAVLSLLILGTYVAVAGLLGMTVGARNLQVAVVVAVVAALALEPLRRTLLQRARRLTLGDEVSRDELLLRLGDTLEHTLDRRALTESIAETAMEGLGAQWVRLAPSDLPAVHVGREPRPTEQSVTARLLHGREDLGSISCGPASGRVRVQLETLARQVAMALTNARLADELNVRLAEIEASRQRLVTAEETARRRLERDLHDGAQQDLAALLTRIALARNQLGRADVGKLDRTLETLQADAGEAMRNLRELVSGIHEATLADQGLVAAVESRAGKSPIPVDVHCGPGVRDGRLAAAVESTAFFTVCEALANTLKHGGAQRATITMVLDAGTLRIDVTDDGRGFDPAQVDGSTGLVGLRDRIAAVGGRMEVRSAPGSGTTLTALVPAGT
ncbi:sensor histidine kinase [Pseudonocardia xishanensis]|uniref:histidine kinase n=1 Tax=Pseudonocardia xishanensis TaxID=630995 RepID=A0ABP8RHH1_9PSEU